LLSFYSEIQFNIFAAGVSGDVFEETFFLASKLQRERFYEVVSWASIAGSMNEVEGKRVFLTTEDITIFVASWNVNTVPFGSIFIAKYPML